MRGHSKRSVESIGAAVLIAALMTSFAAMSKAAVREPQRCASTSSSAPKLPPAKFEGGPTINHADLIADLDAWMSGMRALNPDISIRADVERLEQQAARIRSSLSGPMSRRQAWIQFAKLNPYLNDGHNGIYMPDYRDAIEAYIASGGRVVPIEVRFAADHSLRVFVVTSGIALRPNDRVISINGHSAKQMVSAMMERSPGDTPAVRRAWMERRFAVLYWLLYGDTGDYDLKVGSAQSGCAVEVRLAGAMTLPEALQSKPKSEDLFEWRILPRDIGYLRVDTFDPGERDAFADFAKAAFSQFKQRGIHSLIIDVRENGGGDDPLWQQSLMEYITDKPYAQLSHYVQRITKEHADPGDVIGDLKRGDYTDRFNSKPDEPIRFDGPVYILGGPYSYSATIQFMVAAQDFKIAKIAGEETAALSCQTGQSHGIELAKTGLAAFTPTIVYTRPSGHGCGRGVMPDVPIMIDEVMPDDTLNDLAVWIGAH